MNIANLADILASVKKLSLDPQDMIMLRCSSEISPEEIEEIKGYITAQVGERQIVVYPQNIDVSVIRINKDNALWEAHYRAER